MTKSSMDVIEKLQKIQIELKAPKTQRNNFGNYYYRSAEDILEAIKPMAEKYGVTFFITEHLVQVGDKYAITSYAKCFCIETLSEVVAEANAIIDFDAKGMQMPQRTGAASSYAKKYALGNLLLLDDTKDSDATNRHGNKEPREPSLEGNKEPILKDYKILDREHPKYDTIKKYLEDGGDVERVTKNFTIKDDYLMKLINKS
jgi:hypothetical protein